jgi:centrosomal CEP192-like protein/ASPM-SPD-2-Hydin domain-containing protein/HYDIN/CFA65/VesB family protein/transmembrane protein TMEM131
MARLSGTRGNAGKRHGASVRSGWAISGLLALALCGGAGLSGCAGLASPSNASPSAQATVQISPANMTFSNVPVGQKSTQTATLTNTGSEPITVTQMSVSSSAFTASGIPTPLRILPGQTTKFQVVFIGSTSGTASGTLTALTSHGEGSSKVKLNGSAAKQTAQLVLSSSSLNFGSVLVNGRSTQAVTIQNTSQTDIQISQIAVSGAGFSVSGVATPVTVPAGQSMALQATFAPTATGSAAGGITVTSDATNPTANVALSGSGVAATYTMAVAPGSVNFGNINVGSSATQTVQISNTGNTSVTVTQVAASGAGVSLSGVSVPLTLAPAQSVAVKVGYAPTASGAIAGGITVTNNDGVNVSAAVTGTGVQAALSVTPTSASFGSVVSGNTNSQTIQLKNSGTANLTISQATVTGAGFSLAGLSLPQTLTPGQSGNFNVQYAPQGAGNMSGAVSILSNAPNSPTTIALSGTSVAATSTISVNPTSISFGSVTDGSSATQGFTVTNTGNSNVAISGMNLTGNGYSILSGAGAVTLSPNQSTSVSVQFAPTTAGSASGGVSIVSNATGSASSVSLSGSGVAPKVQHTVGLNWGASTSSVAGYNVYRSTVNGSSYAKVNSALVAGSSFSDASVQSGQTYYYVATAVDGSGNESVYSNEVAAAIP